MTPLQQSKLRIQAGKFLDQQAADLLIKYKTQSDPEIKSFYKQRLVNLKNKIRAEIKDLNNILEENLDAKQSWM